MTITLAGHANPRYLGQMLAAQFPAMAGKTQVICTNNRRAGNVVAIMTNAAVNATEVETYVRSLSAQTVQATQALESVLTPDEQPRPRRRR